MEMRTNVKVSTLTAAKRIVQVLHEEKIPLSLFDKTFSDAKELAMRYTLPYSPMAAETAFLANSASIAKETEEAQE